MLPAFLEVSQNRATAGCQEPYKELSWSSEDRIDNLPRVLRVELDKCRVAEGEVAVDA